MMTNGMIEQFRKGNIALHLRTRTEVLEAVAFLDRKGIRFKIGPHMPSWESGYLVCREGHLLTGKDTQRSIDIFEEWGVAIVGYADPSPFFYQIRLPKEVASP